MICEVVWLSENIPYGAIIVTTSDSDSGKVQWRSEVRSHLLHYQGLDSDQLSVDIPCNILRVGHCLRRCKHTTRKEEIPNKRFA